MKRSAAVAGSVAGTCEYFVALWCFAALLLCCFVALLLSPSFLARNACGAEHGKALSRTLLSPSCLARNACGAEHRKALSRTCMLIAVYH